MNRALLDQVKEVLAKDGYTNFETHSDSHSFTLSAEKGKVQAVFHITEQAIPVRQPSRQVSINREIPAAHEIRVKATVPPGLATGLAGEAGRPSRQPEPRPPVVQSRQRKPDSTK